MRMVARGDEVVLGCCLCCPGINRASGSVALALTGSQQHLVVQAQMLPGQGVGELELLSFGTLALLTAVFSRPDTWMEKWQPQGQGSNRNWCPSLLTRSRTMTNTR